MDKLEMTFLGYDWAWSGDLFYMDHPDGRRATVAVDSVGNTYVAVHRIPAGGAAAGHYFYTERVDSFRAYNGAEYAAKGLAEQGFGNKKVAQGAHRVRERGF